MNLPVIQLRPYIAYRLSKLAGSDNLSFLTKLPYGLYNSFTADSKSKQRSVVYGYDKRAAGLIAYSWRYVD